MMNDEKVSSFQRSGKKLRTPAFCFLNNFFHSSFCLFAFVFGGEPPLPRHFGRSAKLSFVRLEV